MKKSIEGILSLLSKKEISMLTTVVEETIAIEAIKKQEKVFTAADLWSIHKGIKNRSIRKYF